MRDFEKQDAADSFNQDIHSKVIRAGRRTYFFDVKSTRNNEMYLVITESKKRIEDDGNSFYEKHKIFLYHEDIENFRDALDEVSEFISIHQPEIPQKRFADSDESAESEKGDKSV
jgi:hypothetical protein